MFPSKCLVKNELQLYLVFMCSVKAISEMKNSFEMAMIILCLVCVHVLLNHLMNFKIICYVLQGIDFSLVRSVS